MPPLRTADGYSKTAGGYGTNYQITSSTLISIATKLLGKPSYSATKYTS